MESNGNDKKELMKPEDRAVALANEPSVFLNVAKFEQMQRVAVMLSKTDFIPAAFKGNVGNCMIALDMASLMGMHPIMLMRTMYIVHGQPGFEGKFISALINNSGRYNDPLEYEWRGKQGEPQWGCRAFAVRKSTGKTVYGPWVDWRMVQAEGWHKPKGTQPSKWTSIPEIMFLYRAATFFGRVNDSDLLMGMRTIDEIEDTDAELVRQPDGAYGVPSNEKPTAATYAATGKPPEMSGPAAEESGPLEAKKDKGHGTEKSAMAPDDTPHSTLVDEYGTDHNSPWEKSKWFNLRSGDGTSTGLGPYIEMFKDKLSDMTKRGFDALSNKYERVYMGKMIPYGPDGEPAEQPAAKQPAEDPVIIKQEEKDQTAEQPAEVNILETKEAKLLAQMAQDYKREYIMIVKNRIPESVEQINRWMHQIVDLHTIHQEESESADRQVEQF